MLLTDLTPKGSIFQRATKNLISILILILETNSQSELYDRSWIGFRTGVSNAYNTML